MYKDESKSILGKLCTSALINEIKLADEITSQIKIQAISDSYSHETNACKFNSKVTLKLLYILTQNINSYTVFANNLCKSQP